MNCTVVVSRSSCVASSDSETVSVASFGGMALYGAAGLFASIIRVQFSWRVRSRVLEGTSLFFKSTHSRTLAELQILPYSYGYLLTTTMRLKSIYI